MFDICRNSILLMLLILAQVVDARYCWHIFHGYTQYFYCSPNQTCCGTKCCDNIIAFYRLWYFWMCMLMLFVVCSGGGFWLRRRNHSDGLRESLTTSEEGFVRNLQIPNQNLRSQRRTRRVNVNRPSRPISNDETTLPELAQQPPPYSDVVSSKPPSYDSLYRDTDQRRNNQPEDSQGGVPNTENKDQQPPEYKVT